MKKEEEEEEEESYGGTWRAMAREDQIPVFRRRDRGPERAAGLFPKW